MPPLLRAVTAGAAGYALVGGALTLVGWWRGIPGLMGWSGHPITMKANTAICAVAGGGALVTLALGGSRRLGVIRTLAALLCVLAGLTLVEHATGVNLGIDTLIFPEAPGAPGTPSPGRMGLPASVSFAFLGATLWLLLGGSRARRLAGGLAVVPVTIAMLSIVGYLFGASELYGVARVTGVALQTSTMIVALGVAVIAAVPEHGFVALLRRDDLGGLMFRRMLMPLLFLPLMAGWLRLAGERAGLYDTAFGTSARSLVEMVALVALMWWTARSVSRQAQAARRAEQALREADTRKDEFLATLAHELRNPLAPLRTALDIANRRPDDRATLTRAHAMMERQVDQMVHLVDDLLDVSRISRGSVELRQEAADLAVVLENAIETSSPLIDESRHVLLVTKPPEPVFVHGDVTRLAQVIGNLLSNAAKYTAPGGRIQLEVERVGGEVAICVRDNGVGIRAEDMSRVFEMFTRVAAPADRSRGGLGIGLALVKQIVGLHGGRVEVHSPPRGGDASASSPGSEFIVYLPTFAPLAAPVRREAETVRAPLRPPALRILIADDNVDAAETLTMLLEAMGHETRTTHDGAAALEGAADFRPDVAFLDLGMAGLSGLDVCRRIRAEPWGKGVVVVALTGWGQPEDRQRSADAGFDHHLVKPAPLEALTEILAAVRPAALAQRA